MSRFRYRHITVTVAAAAAAGLALAATPSASAQELAPETSGSDNRAAQKQWTETVPRLSTKSFLRMLPDRLGIKIGAFSSAGTSSDALRSDQPYSNRNNLFLGVTYALQPPRKQTLLRSDWYLDYAVADQQVDYFSSNGNMTRGRQFIGMGLSARADLHLFHGAASVFAGAGGGLYRVERFTSNTIYSDPYNHAFAGTSTSPDRMGFRGGFKVFTGLKLRGGISAEAAYHRVGNFDDTLLDGLSLSIGYQR